MLGDLHPDTRTLSVTLHLRELHAAARHARLARQARRCQERSPWQRLGHLLIAAGRALLGAREDAEAWAPAGSPTRAPTQSVLVRDAAPPGAVIAVTDGVSNAGRTGPVAGLDAVAELSQIGAWNRSVRCAEVVGAYLPLRPCAVGYVGAYPWPAPHGDSTELADLVVYAAIGRWRCLATGESGTAFDFVCRMERLSPAETLALCLQRWPAPAAHTVAPRPRCSRL